MHHGEGLRAIVQKEGAEDQEARRWVAALTANYQKAPIAEADRVMLDYAVKLTTSPSAIGPPDMKILRDANFNDRAIHDLCATVAYFAFVNRIADGLGVELEPRWGQPPTEKAGD